VLLRTHDPVVGDDSCFPVSGKTHGGRHLGCSRTRLLSRGGGGSGPTRRAARKRNTLGGLIQAIEAVTARPPGVALSRPHRVSVCDRRCPGLVGWGISIAASGRRDGGRKHARHDATPGLRQLGWAGPARGMLTRSEGGSPP